MAGRLGDGFTVDDRGRRPARADHARRRARAAVEVRHQWPPRFDDPGLGRLVADPAVGVRLDPARLDRAAAAGVDEVWVPSSFVRDMYVGDGIRPTACTWCRTASTSTSTARTARAAACRRTSVCVFLFVGGTIYRKGIDVLLAAFEEAFAGRDDVLLVVKDVGAGTFYSGMNVGDELRRPRGGRRECRVLSDDLDDEGLAALYRGATCSCTRTAARASRCRCWRRWRAAGRCS